MASAAPRFDPAHRRSVTAALLLVTSLASLEATIVATAMPTIIGELGGLTLYSWVFAAYLLTSTVAMPFYGRLADLYGRKRVLIAAAMVFLTGAAACALAQTMPHLIAARALQGLGAAGLLPITITIAGDIYTLEERARVQSYFSTIWACSSVAGPLLGAWLTVALGWRSVFLVVIPLGLLAMAVAWRYLKESRAELPHSIDGAGALLLAAGASMLLLAVSGGREGGPGTLRRLALAASGAALLALFLRLQRRRAYPLVPPELLRHSKTALPYLGAILLGTTIFGVDTFVPLFVQGARGGSAGAAGAVITPLMFFWASSAAVAARLVVRLGFRRLTLIGASFAFVGLCGLVAVALFDLGVPVASACCALIGAGLGPASLSQILAVQVAVAEKDRGVASSLVPFFRVLGGAIGVGALGGVFSAELARRLGPGVADAGRILAGHGGAIGIDPVVFRQALESSLVPVFAVLVGLAAVNVAVSARFPERRRES
jgi:MFS family permease